jgi:hypothetical protein
MSDAPAPKPDVPQAVATYKEIFARALARRPSGMKRRLAEALDSNPSFISQICNPAYPTPIPAAHVGRIIELCHFSASEKADFLAAYEVAHPRRAVSDKDMLPLRTLTVRVPDTGDKARNAEIDRAIHDLAARLARIFEI